MMRRTNVKSQRAFEEAAGAQEKPQLRLVREDKQPLPLYKALSAENYRLWQYEQQRKQLAENLKDAAAPVTIESMKQQHQQVIPRSEEYRHQAAMQGEKGFAFKL